MCQVCVCIVSMSIWHERQTGDKFWKQGKENIDQSCTANVNTKTSSVHFSAELDHYSNIHNNAMSSVR